VLLGFTVTDSAPQTSVVKLLRLTVVKKTQVITAADLTARYGDSARAAGAVSSASLPLEFSSSDPSHVTVDAAGSLTFVAVGTSTITVTASGDDSYLPASTTFLVTVSAAPLTVTAPSPHVVYGDPLPALDPQIDGFVNGDTAADLLTAPSCASSYTTASGAGSAPAVTCTGATAANYEVSEVAGTVIIARAPQTLSAAPDSLNEMAPGTTQSFTAASSSGLEPTVTASGACTWSAGVITAGADEGTCILTITIGQSANYLAASTLVRTANVVLGAKLNRTLTLTLDHPEPSHPITDALQAVTTLDPDAGTVTLSVDPDSTEVCAIAADGTITLLAPGVCTIHATVAEDDTYSATEQQLSFTVTRGSRTLGISAGTTSGTVGSQINLQATPSAGSGTIAFALESGSDHCSLSGDVITGLAVGSCEVRATITADADYGDAQSELLTLEVVEDTSTPTPSATPSETATPTPTPSVTPSDTATPTPTPSATPTETATPTPTPTSTDPGAPTGSGSPDRPQVLPATASGPSPLVVVVGHPRHEKTKLVARARLPHVVGVHATPIGQAEAPRAPVRTGTSIDTHDTGTGIQQGPPTGQLDSAHRTLSQMSQESWSGFAPGSGVTVWVTGARTMGQFAVSPVNGADPVTIGAAIDESSSRLATGFAAITSSGISSRPSGAEVLGGSVSADALRAVHDAGLPTPITVGQLNVDRARSWLSISAVVNGYQPGSVVYLVVTTRPTIFGAAVVGRDGTAKIEGMLPADLLVSGGHDIRVIGSRLLSGIVADHNGRIQLSTDAITQIQRFDAGTTATVRLVGANPTGGAHQVIRIVTLSSEAPWWTVWALALGGLVLLGLARIGMCRRSVRALAVIATVALMGLPVIVGWVARSYDVVTVGILVGAVLVIGQLMLTRLVRWVRGFAGRGRSRSVVAG